MSKKFSSPIGLLLIMLGISLSSYAADGKDEAAQGGGSKPPTKQHDGCKTYIQRHQMEYVDDDWKTEMSRYRSVDKLTFAERFSIFFASTNSTKK